MSWPDISVTPSNVFLGINYSKLESKLGTCTARLNPVGTAAPFGGQTTALRILSGLSPKRDCSTC